MEAYLDNAATTFVFPEVKDIMVKVMEEDFGNPSSLHKKGVEAEQYIKEAKETIAKLLKVEPKEILFTSGGTESNNMALIGSAYANKRRGNHIITTRIEHASVYNPLIHLEEEGFRITYLPVDERGIVELEALKEALCEETILVSIMGVNNEIGAVQPIEEIGRIIKGYRDTILFHVDAIQAYGKFPLYPKRWKVDLLSVSGHLIQVAVEVALLVRILAVAQGRLVVGRATEGRSVLAVEVGEDGRVVVGRYAEGFLGKPAALLQRRRGATLHEDVAQRLVLRLRGHDDHVVVVLGCRADQRDAAYVDLLDDVCLGCAASHGRLERIEVHDDQVYFGDVIFLDLLLVLLQGATAEDAAENLGMQRLDAPAQDGGIGRQVFHRRARIAQRFDELACASRRKEFHAFFVQFGNDLVQSFFVVYRYQRSLDSLCIGHNFYVYKVRVINIMRQRYEFCFFTCMG